MTVRELINGNRQALAAGLGAAAGGVTVWTLLAKLSAEQLLDLTKNLGGYFIIILAILVMGVRVGDRLVERLDRFVAEQAKQSAAIQIIAQKDDRRGQSQDLLLNHLARTAERTEVKLDGLQTQFQELTKRG